MKNEFDCEGLLFAIKEIEKAHVIPLPEEMKKFGFCLVCLGNNYPGQGNIPKGGFCCGTICDGERPAWGVCERFKVDRERVAVLAKSVRPDGTKQTASCVYG